MPTYRGISQTDIVSSITEAQSLLLAHSTGPALEDHIGMVAEHAIAAIACAKTDSALAQAVEQSYAQANFTWIAALLAHHALANTDGKGEAVYNNLQKWGALDGVRSLVLSAVDIEIEKYIGRQTPANDLVAPGTDKAVAPSCTSAFVAPPRR